MKNEQRPERVERADMSNAQRAWNGVCDAAGWEHTDVDTGEPLDGRRPNLLERLRATTWWLPFIGWVQSAVCFAVVVWLVFVVGFTVGSRTHTAGAQSAPVDRSTGLPTKRAEPTTVYRAPAADSLRVTILDGSSAVLAPGATLTITPRRGSLPGAIADLATLTGFAHFNINDRSKQLTVNTASGIAVLERGITELEVKKDTLIARGLTGGVFVRPGGFWSWKSVQVTPGHEVRAPVGAFVSRKYVKAIGGKQG